MLEKKINSLKSTIFIRGCVYSFLIILSLGACFMLREEYMESILRVNSARPMVGEMRSKLHEITGSQSVLNEGIALYNAILNLDEDDLCREYNNLLLKITELRNKYGLSAPINATLSPKSTKSNVEHNKKSYIAINDLKINFNAYDLPEAVDIFNDIISLLPKNSMVYLLEAKETTLTPKNIVALEDNTKPFLISSRLYVKLRNVLLNK